MPVPMTAMVAGPGADGGAPSSAPSCAAPSMPSARPDTTQMPWAASVRANWRALALPWGVGLRLPTMAMARSGQ